MLADSTSILTHTCVCPHGLHDHDDKLVLVHQGSPYKSTLDCSPAALCDGYFMHAATQCYAHLCVKLNIYICTYRAAAITPISYILQVQYLTQRAQKSTVAMYMTCMLQVDLSDQNGDQNISNNTIAAGHIEVFRLYLYLSLYIACTYTHTYTPLAHTM